MPAISAASAGREHLGAALPGLAAAGVVEAEVGARGGLDPVGAVAEVDRVEVVAQDPLLRPLARDLVGQRGLAELLEDRALALRGQRVLDELHRDRRAALDRLLGAHVRVERAADAAQVDAGVGVEAAVLDRDDRLLHHGRDLLGLQEDPLLVAGQHAERLAVAIGQDGVAAGGLLQRRQVGRDRHHHPEERRDDREDAEAEQHAEYAQLADPDAPGGGLVVEQRVAFERDDGRVTVVGLGLGLGRRGPAARGGRGAVAAARRRARRRARGGRTGSPPSRPAGGLRRGVARARLRCAVLRRGGLRRGGSGAPLRRAGEARARPRAASAWRCRRPGGCRARIRSCA